MTDLTYILASNTLARSSELSLAVFELISDRIKKETSKSAKVALHKARSEAMALLYPTNKN